MTSLFHQHWFFFSNSVDDIRWFCWCDGWNWQAWLRSVCWRASDGVSAGSRITRVLFLVLHRLIRKNKNRQMKTLCVTNPILILHHSTAARRRIKIGGGGGSPPPATSMDTRTFQNLYGPQRQHLHTQVQLHLEGGDCICPPPRS